MTRKALDDDSKARDYHRSVGFIFQNSNVQFFCTSLGDEIAFDPLQTGMSRNEANQRVNGVKHIFELAIRSLEGKTFCAAACEFCLFFKIRTAVEWGTNASCSD